MRKDRKATIEGYNNTLIKIGTFCDLNSLTLSMVTPVWLNDFEAHMKKQGLAVNSIFTHMRNIRAVFNDAINTDRISQNMYPFRKYKLKTEKTLKRSLTVDELRLFMKHPLQPHQERYRDIFMLIFYMQGINIIDLLNLKVLHYGCAEFRRSKTGRLYSIKIEQEAQFIIDKYKGDDYLLDIMDRYSDYRNFRSRMNDGLQKIGTFVLVENAAKDEKYRKKNKKEITPLFPDLTTYWARHTWATIAAGLDIPKETIAAALGHGGNSVTDIYIDFDRKKIDIANRKVIDYVSGDKEQLNDSLPAYKVLPGTF